MGQILLNSILSTKGIQNQRQLRLIHGYLLLKIWLKSRLSHVHGIYVIVNELRFPGCFDLILVRMD